MKTILALTLIVVLLASCQPKTQAERQRVESLQSATNLCSKQITGFQRIVEIKEVDMSAAEGPSRWYIEANVEFINRVGGIERTNLPIEFYDFPPQPVSAQFNHEEISRRDHADWQKSVGLK